MSRTRNEYNRHVIHVTSFPLADANFTVHFDIEAHRGGHIDVTHFQSGQSFASDAKAIEAGLQMRPRLTLLHGYQRSLPGMQKDNPRMNICDRPPTRKCHSGAPLKYLRSRHACAKHPGWPSRRARSPLRRGSRLVCDLVQANCRFLIRPFGNRGVGE